MDGSDQPTAKKSKTLASTTSVVVTSALATVLLLKWGWGCLTSADCQELAMAARLDGNSDEEIDIIASCGAYGQNPGSIHKNLMTKFCADMKCPKPRSIVIPFKESKDASRSTNFTDVKMFLPSDWLTTLANSTSLNVEYSSIFGLDRLGDFWSKQSLQNPKIKDHPMLKRKNYKEKAIPIFLHGDGAQYQNNDTLTTVSFSGVLKEGDLLETNLFLCSWAKSNAASGKESSWDTFWRWLVWDLNQLYFNQWDDTDPWGNPLPEDVAERAGKPILHDDFFVVVWGVLGDNDYFQNDLGCPHHACKEPKACCEKCNCTKAGEYRWFNWNGPWVGSLSERHEPQHPISKIIGWTPYHFMADWLHVVDLGVASHACANILWDIVFNKMKQSTRQEAVNSVSEFLMSAGVEQGSELDGLELKHFCNPKKTHGEYPDMHFLKAAQIRGLVGKLAMYYEGFDHKNIADRQKLKMIQSLAVVYEIMYSSDVILTKSEYKGFNKASMDFLNTYSWLSSKFKENSKFNIVPKFHYFFHLVEQAEYLNPKYSWCYQGEDLVGKASSLAHSCTRATSGHHVPSKMMEKYQVAKHLQFTRQ